MTIKLTITDNDIIDSTLRIQLENGKQMPEKLRLFTNSGDVFVYEISWEEM
jgi:hypothetical protein